MDVRGVEVTNQLRSAIRAKLLELGVRYDEELPDYILVMVVNKKSRQQMHEDLHLFLDESTTPFVDWLHDQVLKKLQKVSVAKKKSTREFVPTVVVKQEEERKKKKNIALTEDLKIKVEEQTAEKTTIKIGQKEKTVNDTSGISNNKQQDVNRARTKTPETPNTPKIPDSSMNIIEESEKPINTFTAVSKKIIYEEKTPERIEKNNEKIETSIDKTIDEDITPEKKLKSCVNKPRITSVVSVKTRLGITSPKKKIDNHYKERNERNDTDNNRKIDKPFYEPMNRRSNNNNYRNRNFDDDLSIKQRNETSNRQFISTNNRNRIDKKNEKDLDTKIASVSKLRGEISSGNDIKKRLGIGNKIIKQNESFNDNSNVKNRLGAVKRKFQALGRLGSSPVKRGRSVNREDDNFYKGESNFHKEHQEQQHEDDDIEKEDEDDDDDEETKAPVKSHIIAVNKIVSEKTDKRLIKNKEQKFDEEEEEHANKGLASKIIVTPRPLKPLQPVQKRATQSLLLRAVAEANRSVVKQKNPEPISPEKNPVLKRPMPSGTNAREVGQNLSVRLNATKRLVMEKIQVELTNPESLSDTEPEPYIPRSVTDEQMGVVMSLFQHGNDTQKFLVTLNGYSNNSIQNIPAIDDDTDAVDAVDTIDTIDEYEVNENVLTSQQNELLSDNNNVNNIDNSEDIDMTDKIDDYENNENHCIENLNINDETPRKRRKLSPIVYSRSPSPNPVQKKIKLTTGFEKKPAVTTIIINEKSREKCRYWPSCTLGAKCAYVHPPVPCSAFPACKFGDKCAYKHPKCKFGLSCTKLGCVFSHPSQQCKYHPFCTKSGCVYLHPTPIIHQPQVTPQLISTSVEKVRGKFTWRRQD
ncbi:hypothetical protein HCN44_002095 [Aphidius gifuensis]|uniref:Zinc finger CCCH domain-containing protein 14 n=1 Tax=Aphidius gifuensis TaxID=684658 RepID=A0A834XZJ4_APHGI|nr:zinc finger CCCH domain-containing protein 14 [Aphidius gifuensis]KAF7996463.1 hypothetical protein HCN44_002095 [Aphidius gifuensis]